MPDRVPAIRYTSARRPAHTNGVTKLRTQLRLHITFSLALPLHNVISKVSPCTYGRTVVQPNFSAWLTTISYNYGATLRALRALRVPLLFYVSEQTVIVFCLQLDVCNYLSLKKCFFTNINRQFLFMKNQCIQIEVGTSSAR